jgi:hypothetical protein
MDLFIRFLMVCLLAGANLKQLIGHWYQHLWKIGFVVVFLYYLFVKFAHHERIKTNNRCCFYLSQPVFATVFAIGLAG